MHPVTLSFKVSVGALTADVVSPVRPVPSHRCIRCSNSPLQLSRHCTGALLWWGTGVSGPEELLVGCLTCSLSSSIVLAPLFQLTLPVHPVQLELLPLGLGIAQPQCTGHGAPVHPMLTG